MKILGIGNAIVDVLCRIDDEFLKKNSLQKSTMKLINEIELTSQAYETTQNKNKLLILQVIIHKFLLSSFFASLTFVVLN